MVVRKLACRRAPCCGNPGCYPLTRSIESAVASMQEIIEEMLDSRSSERQRRVIDCDEAGSMKQKKRAGYS